MGNLTFNMNGFYSFIVSISAGWVEHIFPEGSFPDVATASAVCGETVPDSAHICSFYKVDIVLVFVQWCYYTGFRLSSVIKITNFIELCIFLLVSGTRTIKNRANK